MRTIVTTTLAVALLFLAQGCDSTVERTEPSTAISQTTALSNPDAIRGLRASMFDRMHSTGLSTDWLLGPSSLADNTSFRGNQERHQGLNVNALRAGVGGPAYGPGYSLINDANLLIGGIQEDALEPAVASKFRAEAYFMRALVQHHLVRSFGYDPNGNGGVVSPNSGPGQGFNLGIVLRTEPTLDVQQASSKPRATVPEVYDQIISDLEAADSTFAEVPAEVRENSRFFPSEAAVQGLLARVQLYQRNWGAANTAAQNAIDLASSTFGSDLASGVSGLTAIFDETTGGNPEAIFEIDTDPATESVGINNAISAYTSIQWLAQLPTQDLISTYDSTDARLEAWYEPCFDEATGSAEDGCTGVNDQGLELHKYASEQGVSRYADDYPHLRIAEMVLIQAEARLNTDGIGAAINRLNDLREQRNAPRLDPVDYEDQEAAMDEILAERRRELVAEGHRFFDLKRLGRDIQKPLGNDALLFNSPKILDDIPTNQLSINEQLVQNPGYN
jgi:hypothetical protein